jgi:hypothetical protein
MDLTRTDKPPPTYSQIVELLQDIYGQRATDTIVIPLLIRLWQRFRTKRYNAANPGAVDPSSISPSAERVFKTYVCALFDRAQVLERNNGSSIDPTYPDCGRLVALLVNTAFDTFLDEQHFRQVRGDLIRESTAPRKSR